jgi:hypothetical protein
MSAQQVAAKLRGGSPAVYVDDEEPGVLTLDPATLLEGDEQIVADRIRALLG